MKSLGLDNILTSGELAHRARRNLYRFQSEDYSLQSISGHNDGWPGDYEGRTLLALVLEARATHLEPQRLHELLAAVPSWLNTKGYFGPVLPEGEYDEQQLAGNSWSLRAMCELYEWRGDHNVLQMIKRLVESLYLPAMGAFASYPCQPYERSAEGGVYGNLTGRTLGGWHISSDTGCAFIALDGVSHAYAILRNERLGLLAMEMTEKFLSVDVVTLSYQTHATLSALRGVLRLHEATGEAKWLERAERVFGLYCREAMTENYENYNWFGRPSWTEPCAVVDSFIIAAWLWRLTKNTGYLELAHCIWFNGVAYEQRANGGFGCNTCSGAANTELSPSDIFEASWCCTMRGAEGIAKATELSGFLEDDALVLPLYNDDVLRVPFIGGTAIISMRTHYPMEGLVSLDVLAGRVGEKMLCFYMPSWVNRSSIALMVNGVESAFTLSNGFVVALVPIEPGCFIELKFSIGLRKEPTKNIHTLEGYQLFKHGPLVLSVDISKNMVVSPAANLQYIGNGQYLCGQTGIILYPLLNHLHLSFDVQRQDKRQILFRVE